MKKLVLKELNLGVGDILQKKELKTIFGGYTFCCECDDGNFSNWGPCHLCDSALPGNGCPSHSRFCGSC